MIRRHARPRSKPIPVSAPPQQAPDGIVIAIEDVVYRYPSTTNAPTSSQAATAAPALNGVSLRIRRGEYVALLGHNGSGKSTLARMLNGLLLPSSGRVLIMGHDTSDPASRREIRDLVGMIFSDPDNQIVATIVEDDVAWGLAARGYPLAEVRARAAVALEAVGLSEAHERAPNQLSGGQRQRLAIAGVLAIEPTCLVADEPTALLDPKARIEMTGLLRRLNRERGLTVVHVTHLLEEAALADRIVVLEQGRIAMQGKPPQVFADLDRLRALRLIIPDLAQLGERLRAVGLAIPPDALTPEQFVAALDAALDAALAQPSAMRKPTMPTPIQTTPTLPTTPTSQTAPATQMSQPPQPTTQPQEPHA
ncbi:MAG TPA: ATP-binding cassette domain-containing protein [Ktedonobacterales bacterium]|nr:ATP-binding cassette domain-containing protein [Ktedonobacterales bacterium]